jgi:tripartite-type tricarboxylate transporter receptor subunit TctC
MGMIFEINRDFQVPLSFDEAAMEVLDWLEECKFEWDMIVVNSASPYRTLSDLLGAARTKPGELTLAHRVRAAQARGQR